MRREVSSTLEYIVKMRVTCLTVISLLGTGVCLAQSILPTPLRTKPVNSTFEFKEKVDLAYVNECPESVRYLTDRLKDHTQLNVVEANAGDIVLSLETEDMNLGKEGYMLKVTDDQVKIASNSETGLFYGIQSLLQLLPGEVLAGKKTFNLSGVALEGLEIVDQPKYPWRSFMLDSGRQYQTPEFIKRYLDYLAMLKMNVFHWHLTEGQGWRVEIKKYPKLTEIGSKVASGPQQQGFYSQEEIKDIVAYARQRHIQVVPEIDVPGHAEAALMAYPEMTCFRKQPKSLTSYSTTLFCAGREKTYQFLQNVLDEVCELFPSDYIHLGGDEALKKEWDQCPYCQKKIEEEGLEDSQDLQKYFSASLAQYLKTKGKKAIFWGDIIYEDGTTLPDNVVVHWWNWKRHGKLALDNAVRRGHEVICNTNRYTYLNFPLTPWENYQENRTFDLKTVYEENPSDLTDPHELVIGMGSCLWTDRNVQEHMTDRRIFPRIYALSEQMWSSGERLPFEKFYQKVQENYALLDLMDVDYGPALREEVPEGYSWD